MKEEFARDEFGMAEAVTERIGAEVGFATDGVSHDGHEPVRKSVRVPEPVVQTPLVEVQTGDPWMFIGTLAVITTSDIESGVTPSVLSMMLNSDPVPET